MKVIVIIILILTIINTCLLLSKYHYQQTEGYFDTSNRTPTGVDHMMELHHVQVLE